VLISTGGTYSGSSWSSSGSNGAATISSGTEVLSYLVHSDSEGETITCKMIFTTDLLGGMGFQQSSSVSQMSTSHTFFSPSTTFCAEGGTCSRNWEDGDSVVVSSNMREITSTSKSMSGKVDQMRLLLKPKILTDVPPGGLTACPKICNPDPCPVDCQVDAWQDWTACSATCGCGGQSRSRWVLTPAANGGTACPALVETAYCSTDSCATDNIEVSHFSPVNSEVSGGAFVPVNG
jgi:hypothetical protein